MKEYAQSHFPTVPYWKLTTNPDQLDDVHSEIDVRKRQYSDPLTLNAFVTQAPIEEQPTKVHGIDWERPIELNIPTLVAVEAGLLTLREDRYIGSVVARMGDKFGYGYDQYHNLMVFEVLNVRFGDRIFNTEIPVYLKLEASIFRQDSADVVTFDMDP